MALLQTISSGLYKKPKKAAIFLLKPAYCLIGRPLICADLSFNV